MAIDARKRLEREGQAVDALFACDEEARDGTSLTGMREGLRATARRTTRHGLSFGQELRGTFYLWIIFRHSHLNGGLFRSVSNPGVFRSV